MARNILNWPRGLKIFFKVLLMLIFCAGLCAVPILVQNSLLNAISFSSGASISAKDAAGIFFAVLYIWFAGFLVLMLLINLVFLFVDEWRNDMVKWRRGLQVLLNVAVILAGLIAWFFVYHRYYPGLSWWSLLLLRASFAKRMNWLPYAAFAACAAMQMIWDIWFFGPSGRTPWIARMLHSSARKQALKKENKQ